MSSAKNIVITGGNTGIGLETARALFGDGNNIIFGSRNEEKNAEAVKSITASFPNSKGSVRSFQLDLSKRASIEAFADHIKGQFPHIDILINNAGMLVNQRKLNEAGIEMTMAVNHFGPFYLTYLLFPLIKKSKEARIINVSSRLHASYKGSTVEDLPAANNFSYLDAYNKSKLANVQFTTGLAERLGSYPYIKTMSLHPGVVDSDFLSNQGCCSMFKIFKVLCCCMFVDTQTGARTSLYLARQPFGSLKSGQYYDDDTSIGEMNPLGRNKDDVNKLWKASEQSFKIQFSP